MNEFGNFENLDKLRADFKGFYNTVKEDLKDYHGHSWGHFLKDFSVCGLSSVALVTPLYAFLETVLPKLANNLPEFYQFFPDMGVDDSAWLRLTLSPFILAGGYIGDKLRTKSRKKIKESSMEHHDGSFGSKMGFLTNVISYGIKFGGDLVKTAVMTVGSIPVSYVSGMAEGFTTDFMKNAILNEKPTGRIPSSLQKTSRKKKLGLTGLMVVASVGVTIGMYELSDYISQKEEPKKINLNHLEKYSLEDAFPEFDNFL
ncbi:MAG: hypothetical protein Q8Q04_02680, partial [archaeon]|nr:hypothetical protein [archaeon]